MSDTYTGECKKCKLETDLIEGICANCSLKRGVEVDKLTLQNLKDMEPATIFAKGEIVDSPQGINMTNSGKFLKWLAVRGGIWDWAIYCHFSDKTYEWVRRFGNKVHSKNHIRKLVPCDDEAFKMYRY